MDFKRLMNTKGISFWLLASAIGLNLIFQVVLLFVTSGIETSNVSSAADYLQVFVLLASLIGPFVIAWIIAGMAGTVVALLMAYMAVLEQRCRSFLLFCPLERFSSF